MANNKSLKTFFKDFNEFQKEIETIVVRKAKWAQDMAVDNEVADQIRDTIKERVKSDVYAAGTPIQYTRRMHSNGLLDDKNITVDSQRVGDTYEIEFSNDAEFDGPTTWNGGSWADSTLAEKLESGYGNGRKWYNKSRPFMSNAEDELNNGSLQDVFDKAFEKYFYE